MADGLKVTFEATAKIDVTVDIAAFYQAMEPKQVANYLAWADHDWWDSDPCQKPAAYATAYIAERAEVSSGVGGMRSSCVDVSEIEEWDTPRVHGRGTYWGEADYLALLAAVPWLAEADRVGEMPDEERAETVARMPGPLDVPLFPEPERRTA